MRLAGHSCRGRSARIGLLEPGKAEFGKMGATSSACAMRPALVGIGGQHAIADKPAQLREIGAVGRAGLKPIFSLSAR